MNLLKWAVKRMTPLPIHNKDCKEILREDIPYMLDNRDRYIAQSRTGELPARPPLRLYA